MLKAIFATLVCSFLSTMGVEAQEAPKKDPPKVRAEKVEYDSPYHDEDYPVTRVKASLEEGLAINSSGKEQLAGATQLKGELEHKFEWNGDVFGVVLAADVGENQAFGNKGQVFADGLLRYYAVNADVFKMMVQGGPGYARTQLGDGVAVNLAWLLEICEGIKDAQEWSFCVDGAFKMKFVLQGEKEVIGSLIGEAGVTALKKISDQARLGFGVHYAFISLVKGDGADGPQEDVSMGAHTITGGLLLQYDIVSAPKKSSTSSK